MSLGSATAGVPLPTAAPEHAHKGRASAGTIQPPNQSPHPTCRVRKRENTDPGRLRLLNPALAAGQTTLDAINVLCAARTPRSRFLLAGLRQGTRPRQTASHNTEGTRGTTALWPGCVLLVSATDLFSREPVGLPVLKHEAFAFPTVFRPAHQDTVASGHDEGQRQRRIAVTGISDLEWQRR